MGPGTDEVWTALAVGDRETLCRMVARRGWTALVACMPESCGTIPVAQFAADCARAAAERSASTPAAVRSDGPV